MKNLLNHYLIFIIALIMILSATGNISADKTDSANKLGVLWTSGDPDVAHRVCLMYTHAAKTAGWFDEVVLIVWGPSARLLTGDKDLQAKIKMMKEDGVIVEACITCADSYGISKALSDLGIDVKPMGKPLSEMLKSNWKIITF